MKILPINNCFIKFLFKLIIIIFIFLFIKPLYAQTGIGGTKSLFLGVGARALSLGNAFVAQSDDPTAVFYNPGGLDYIEKKGASFYYSNLIASSQYNFVGLVYPTLSIGSFGFGWMRIGTGDIIPRDADVPDGGSPFDYSQNLFLFSYAKKLKNSLSVGFSFKIKRVNFSFENLSDSGVGVDLGFLYRPDFDSALLRDLSFGVNIQNLFNPKTRLKNESEASPRNFKIGLAKPIRFGEERNAFTFLFDLNKSERAPSMYHFGAEYAFHNQAMLRIGVNNGLVAFGAGAAYNNFHVDYTFGKLFDGADFSANHRFSITIEIGKGKTELIRLARERQEKEFRLKVENELWFTRETEFNNNMEDGRDKYYNKDYLGAYVDFTRAFDAANALVEAALRLRGENMEDPEANMRVETANSSVQEAQTMLELANVKSDSTRREEIRQITREVTQSALEQELRDFILEHREKGNAFFKSGLFTRAISEWQLAQDRITQNEVDNLPNWVDEIKSQLENNIKMAEKELAGNIKDAIKQADALVRRGQIVQALEALNGVRDAGISETERKTLERKIRSIQSQLTFQQNYEEGVRSYANKDWKRAREAFARALKIKPKDRKTLNYFQDAKARSLATNQEMPPRIRAQYVQGRDLYRQGKYEEALAILEQANKEQPYNKRILDFIDRVRERLKEKK
ncbi:MAG: PorV/PorQ family protein [bacterium]